jgi:hypothetical protein
VATARSTFGARQLYISAALAFQYVGLREEDDGRWLVTFMSVNLGHLATNGFTAL